MHLGQILAPPVTHLHAKRERCPAHDQADHRGRESDQKIGRHRLHIASGEPGQGGLQGDQSADQAQHRARARKHREPVGPLSQVILQIADDLVEALRMQPGAIGEATQRELPVQAQEALQGRLALVQAPQGFAVRATLEALRQHAPGEVRGVDEQTYDRDQRGQQERARNPIEQALQLLHENLTARPRRRNSPASSAAFRVEHLAQATRETLATVVGRAQKRPHQLRG